MKKGEFRVVRYKNFPIGVITKGVRSKKYEAIWFTSGGNRCFESFDAYEDAFQKILDHGHCWEMENLCQ